MVRFNRYMVTMKGIIAVSILSYIIFFLYNSFKTVSYSEAYLIFKTNNLDSLLTQRKLPLPFEDDLKEGSDFEINSYAQDETVIKYTSDSLKMYAMCIPLKGVDTIEIKNGKESTMSGNFLEPFQIPNATAYYKIKDNRYSKEAAIVFLNHDGSYEIGKDSSYSFTSISFLRVETDGDQILSIDFKDRADIDIKVYKDNNNVCLRLTEPLNK